MRFHKDGTLPKADEVFVFGSNMAGRHGAGAAKAARDWYRAQNGVARGPTGGAWALPTKDANLRSLSIDEIREEVDYFLHQAESTPEIEFFVTRIGCGLAGYKDADIAPLFRGAPDNCSFAEEWERYLK